MLSGGSQNIIIEKSTMHCKDYGLFIKRQKICNLHNVLN